MTTQKQDPVEQHNREIQENVMSWMKKPALRAAYAGFYEAIRSCIDPQLQGVVVELGSGMGNIKKFIPDCVTTDLFSNEGVDRLENAYLLSFPDCSVSHLILFDVWHHIEYPANALREFRRVLVPGGRVILCEPSMSIAGRLVYGRCHHEPLGFDVIFSDRVTDLDIEHDTRYFAAQSSCHRLILQRELPNLLDGWQVEEVRQIVSFAYWGSGGFRGPQIYPAAFLQVISLIDKLLSILPSVFAARILATLKKSQ